MLSLADIPYTCPPLIRTDFGDDTGWRSLVGQLLGDQSLVPEGFESEDLEVVTVIEDPQCDDWSPLDVLVARDRGAPGPDTWSFCFVADKDALGAPGFPVLAVPVDPQLQSFRVQVRHLNEVVAPLAVRATGWEQYTDRLDHNGVYRSTFDNSGH